MPADPTLPDRIARLAAAVEAPGVTPGPWTFEHLTADGWALLGNVSEPDPPDRPYGYGEAVIWNRADAVYITDLLNAAPALLRSHRAGEAARAALDFRASVEFVNGYHGGDLLRGIAAWMDRQDECDGNPNHGVQEDLRRWADGIDRALAASDTGEPDVEVGT